MSVLGKAVSIQECLTIADTLDRLLSASFGPNATHNLLSTSTGKLMITSSGRALLQSLNLSHPIGKLLVETALSLHRETGDNVKSFIAVTTEALHQMDNHIDSRGSDSRMATDKLALIKALTQFKLHILPQVQTQLVDDCMEYSQISRKGSCQDYLDICCDLISTSLNGKFNTETKKQLVIIVREYLSQSCSSTHHDLSRVLENTKDNFDFLCVDNPGQSVLNSKVLDGLVIQRNFPAGVNPKLPILDTNMVLVKFALDNACPTETASSIKVGSITQIKNSILYKIGYINKLIQLLKAQRVKLVLASEFVSESTALIFAQHGLYVVHSVEEEDLDHLSHVTGCQVVCEESDILLDTVITPISRVDLISAAGRNCVLIKPKSRLLKQSNPNDRDSNYSIEARTMLICGATPGVCDQYLAAVLGGIRSALLALTPGKYIDLPQTPPLEPTISTYGERSKGDTVGTHGESTVQTPSDKLTENDEGKVKNCTQAHPGGDLVFCPGGGAFEMYVHCVLRQYAASMVGLNPALAAVSDILSKALISVPLRLLHNSYTPKSSSITQLYTLLNIHLPSHGALGHESQASKSVKGNIKLEGVNAKSGQDVLTDTSVIEPMAGKMLMLYYVIEALCQILRIDYMVPVCRLPSQSDGEESDGE